MTIAREQIVTARKADLYSFLLSFHPEHFRKEGHWLRMKSNPSICMKQGCGGYKDYGTLETGNSIDFLVRYMNYDFLTAVSRLTNDTFSWRFTDPPARQFVFPEKAENNAAVHAYLVKRGFTLEVIEELETRELLYQDTRRNAVFRNAAGDFYESRGTWSGRPFHQCGKKAPDCFWSFVPYGSPAKAYICESAIDAVSLYLLHLRSGTDNPGNAYCGIAGVANQKTIERIHKHLPVVLAVDNDAAGDQCRSRNRDLPAVIPRRKDWNEDLISLLNRRLDEVDPKEVSKIQNASVKGDRYGKRYYL